MSTPDPIAAQAAADLAAVREQWGDLLAAISRRPRSEWPPRDSRAIGVVAEDDEPGTGRLPLTLREHPAPLNLAALDAALSVERDLFGLADTVAAAVQRPVRRHPSLNVASYSGRTAPALKLKRTRMVTVRSDRNDPARWIYAAPTDPGSRAYGLHWAAVWVEGRALGEQSGDLFTLVRPLLLDEIAATARRARRAVEQALGRDGQPTALDRPCPYCRGVLTAHTRSGDPMAATVVCATGSACTAPVLLDRGRRMWREAELVTLYVALESATQQA
ncbi:hypothetical protein ACIBKZ_09690 [Streptomyces sp. NPDC050421]|uniref:hypothetical protein n=1 Tax=Streptomyces sp. NPDC050421 TaxID=3365613 RepID=UPI0037A75240